MTHQPVRPNGLGIWAILLAGGLVAVRPTSLDRRIASRAFGGQTRQHARQQTTAAHQKQHICCKICVPALPGVIKRQSTNPVCSGDTSTAQMMRSCVLDRGKGGGADKAASGAPQYVKL
ncbi:hypothetical protein LY76DRAFT_255112 [Colletotrichum caudatum]|nr:hypothetical protein LY76DRAFT_255112 [Colletotrichum caudatum]